MTLDISNIIEVSVVSAPAGLANFNVNNVALFTTDSASFTNESLAHPETFRVYKNTSSVALDFGSTSLTYKMAVAFFSQVPNVLSAGGSLIIVPLQGNDSNRETLIEAITRVQNQCFFIGILDTISTMDDLTIQSTATSIQSLDKIWLHGMTDTSKIAGIATTLSGAGDTQTRLLLHTLSMQDAQLFTAAYAGRGFSVDFTGSNTAITMNLKQLATIPIDTGITQSLYDAANIAGIDLYVSYGVEGVYSTKGNDFFDNVYNKLWLKFALQVAEFNYLATTNSKISQTQAGMDGFNSVRASVYQQGIRNGVIGVGLKWNSPDTFGDPVALNRNITEQGYYIWNAPIASQSESDRIERKAPLCQDAVKFAGAIQTATIISFVEY